MPKFQVQIGRTARVYHTATVEAESLDELRSMDAEDIIGLSDEWEENGAEDPEDMETVNISDVENDEVIARWSESDGWDQEN